MNEFNQWLDQPADEAGIGLIVIGAIIALVITLSNIGKSKNIPPANTGNKILDAGYEANR